MKVEKVIHQGYKEFEEGIKKGNKITQLFGKWNYIYSHQNKKVSLIKLVNYFRDGKDWWEALQVKPTEKELGRFGTKKQAEKEIKEYFGVDELQEIMEEKLKQIKEKKNGMS